MRKQLIIKNSGILICVLLFLIPQGVRATKSILHESRPPLDSLNIVPSNLLKYPLRKLLQLSYQAPELPIEAYYSFPSMDYDSKKEESRTMSKGQNKRTPFQLNSLSVTAFDVAFLCTTKTTGEVTTTISNERGAVVLVEVQRAHVGVNSFILNTEKLPPGIYQIQLWNGKEEVIRSFQK